MKLSSPGVGNPQQEAQDTEEQICLNSELWHACAGPLVSLPIVGSRVVYFPQGHSEQVAASTNKEINSLPSYPSLPPQLVCQLHNVTMHADKETDEVYAQMTLQPLSPQEQKDPYLPTELGTPSKQPTNYFCKTLTASDTSTHGGFSVPRRAAEKVFPPLDFTQQPPCQELIARDLHGNEWKFRHIFRGQPKRHLLTTGWSVFVSAKRLVAGDSVLFIWNDNNQLLLGIRRATRPQTVMPSSVLSSDSMHIGLLAAAAHAAATNSRFTIFYNPRASPSEFVIPLAKYVKAVYHTRISVGMRFRMLFETEESSVRRYMGTITGISDLDPVHWPNSHWRSVKVGWDESTAGQRQPRVSLWEIEPLTTFPMYPPPFPFRLKRPWPIGLPSLLGGKEDDIGLNSSLMWLRNAGNPAFQSLNFQGMGVTPWMQIPPRFDTQMLGLQTDMYQTAAVAAIQETRNVDTTKHVPQMLQFQQTPNTTSRSSPLLPTQVLQNGQPQLPQTFHQNIPINQVQGQPQSEYLQCQLPQVYSLSEQQQQQQQILQQQIPEQQQILHHQHMQQKKLLLNNEQISDGVPSLPQLMAESPSPSTAMQSVSPFSRPQNFPESSNCDPTSTASPLHNLLQQFSPEAASNLLAWVRSNPAISSRPDQLSSKRLAVESMLPPAGDQSVMPQLGQLGVTQTSISQHYVALPPFPGRERMVDQDGNIDSQSHHLFSVNFDSSSLLVQNGMTNPSNASTETDSLNMHYAGSNFVGSLGNDFSSNQALTGVYDFEEPGYLPTRENAESLNEKGRTFVKIYKSGSYGRSLDITRFSSYNELRSELGRLFGLEGQLEDPLRSGWQLVFVDREDDTLLVGDDPWQEFVNNVWCIQILSPQEMQQMGKQSTDSSNSALTKRLPTSSCDDYISRQDSRNLSTTRITSVGSLEY
ncbi:auxin response factor 17-like [Zingiber officinale]|uniref:auxin response factor 17-like n=1 Tax=Zingiber officinale TaxID=94328 RepID=UPI001C4D11EE|nr:auxin response factor 17-like [Zingiber officinale]